MEFQKRRGTLLLPPQFLGSTGYYAAIASADRVVVDTSMRFDKRFKSPHRTPIADANGLIMVNVPIVRPQSLSSARWNEVEVSGHNGWWNIAVTALRSAYGRTPFYEYYEDDFLPLISSDAVGMRLMDLDCDLDRLIRRLAQIDTRVDYGDPCDVLGDDFITAGDVEDYRSQPIDFLHSVEYYQVRADRHGFLPGLSIVDLLFNCGPETPLILRHMTGLKE